MDVVEAGSVEMTSSSNGAADVIGVCDKPESGILCGKCSRLASGESVSGLGRREPEPSVKDDVVESEGADSTVLGGSCSLAIDDDGEAESRWPSEASPGAVRDKADKTGADDVSLGVGSAFLVTRATSSSSNDDAALRRRSFFCAFSRSLLCALFVNTSRRRRAE